MLPVVAAAAICGCHSEGTYEGETLLRILHVCLQRCLSSMSPYSPDLASSTQLFELQRLINSLTPSSKLLPFRILCLVHFLPFLLGSVAVADGYVGVGFVAKITERTPLQVNDKLSDSCVV